MDQRMIPICPLCGGRKSSEIELIPVAALCRLYARMLKERVDREFRGAEVIGFYSCPECGIRFFHPPLTGSDRFYSCIQKLPWYYLDEKSEYAFARRYITEGDRVLEVGCGKGVFFRKIELAQYTGLELSSGAKRMAEENGIQGVINESLRDHARAHPCGYDVVCVFQVLEHVPDPALFLSDLVLCLRPGGLLILSVPDGDSPLARSPNNMLNMPPHHVTWWGEKSLLSIASLCHLELVRMEKELLSTIHETWHSSMVVLRALNGLFRRSGGLLDLSPLGRCLIRVSWVLGGIHPFGRARNRGRPPGHSVHVLYRKGREC